MKATKNVVCVLVASAWLAFGGFGFHVVQGADAQTEKTSSPASSLEQLETYFQKAKEAIGNQAYDEAASEVQKGSDFLNTEAGQATGQVRESLLQAAKGLDRLASGLEQGRVKSMDEMKGPLSQADNALAEYFNAKASESWDKKAMLEGGAYLSAAAAALEKAWLWSGREIESGADAAIRYAREVGDRLEKEEDQVSAEVVEAVDKLGKEIHGFEHKNLKQSKSNLKIVSLRPWDAAGPPGELLTAISRVAEEVIPSVVQILIEGGMEVPNPFLPFERSPFFRQYFGLPKKMPKKFKEEFVGLGTGIIVDSKGYILTNDHVVSEAKKIKVLLSGGDEYPAKVVGVDPKTDLAIIKISTGKPLPEVTFGNSDQVKVGQWVVAIGQPRGLDKTVTQGIISAKHRTGISNPSGYQDFLQTDAPINPGNSGGPLLTLQGEVIGINSAIVTQSGGFEGIGFAIPSNMAVPVANALISHGKVERGWLGISIQEVTPDLAKSFGLAKPVGALIADVMKDGPGEKADLKRGDVVLKYNGHKVPDASRFRNWVSETAIGSEASLVVWRNDKKLELSARIGSVEQFKKMLTPLVKERLGVVVGAVTAEQAAAYGLPAPMGVTIQWLDPKGPLGKAGFEKGDLILAIDRRPIDGVDAFLSIASRLSRNQKVILLALDHQSGQTSYVQVTAS